MLSSKRPHNLIQPIPIKRKTIGFNQLNESEQNCPQLELIRKAITAPATEAQILNIQTLTQQRMYSFNPFSKNNLSLCESDKSIQELIDEIE